MNSTIRMHVFTFALCFLFIVAAASSVGAQQQEGYGQEMMQQPAGSVEVSEAELDKVADAYTRIAEIREDFQESLAEVADPEQAQLLQEEAGEAMVEAVQESGLDVQKYNEVMQAAQVDEELREKLLSRLEQMQ